MEDMKWFIAFLVIMGAVWLGGKSRDAARLAPMATTTPVSQTNSSPSKGTAKQNGLPTGGTAPRGTPGNVISESTLPEPEVDSNLSYWYGKVSISSVSRNSVANREYITLRASSQNREEVVLTGLTLKSSVSLIGQEIPTAWRLPFPTNVGSGEIVTLRPGEMAYIISGHSPNGQSFQLNKCTGYFEQGMNFVPSLPLRCPYPTDDPLPMAPNTLSDTCYRYLEKLGRCMVPPSLIPTNLLADGSCQAHIFSKISYNQCVTYYRDDPDFFQGDWHIYLGRNTRLWRDTREMIELLDGDGRLIDSRSY